MNDVNNPFNNDQASWDQVPQTNPEKKDINNFEERLEADGRNLESGLHDVKNETQKEAAQIAQDAKESWENFANQAEADAQKLKEDLTHHQNQPSWQNQENQTPAQPTWPTQENPAPAQPTWPAQENPAPVQPTWPTQENPAPVQPTWPTQENPAPVQPSWQAAEPQASVEEENQTAGDKPAEEVQPETEVGLNPAGPDTQASFGETNPTPATGNPAPAPDAFGQNGPSQMPAQEPIQPFQQAQPQQPFQPAQPQQPVQPVQPMPNKQNPAPMYGQPFQAQGPNTGAFHADHYTANPMNNGPQAKPYVHNTNPQQGQAPAQYGQVPYGQGPNNMQGNPPFNQAPGQNPQAGPAPYQANTPNQPWGQNQNQTGFNPNGNPNRPVYPPVPQNGMQGNPPRQPSNTDPLALTSVITGILSLVLGFVDPILAWAGIGFVLFVIGIILGAVGIVTGAMAMKKYPKGMGKNNNRTMAVAGLVTGIIGVLLNIIFLTVCSLTVKSIFDIGSKSYRR